MKKNILIGLLAATSVFSIAFGLFEKQRADMNYIKLIEQTQVTKQMELAVSDAINAATKERERSTGLLFQLQIAEEQSLKTKSN